MTSRYILNEDGMVTRRVRNKENSDSLFFTETYEYAEGRLARWKGVNENASCFYKQGKLDSVHLSYADGDDKETYYFKFGYDAGGMLIRADEITLVPNNNPGPDKRTAFVYHGGDSITVKRYNLAGTSDTAWSRVIMRNGLPVRIESPRSGIGGSRLSIRRFTYLPSLGIRPAGRGAQRFQDGGGTGFNLLGRSLPGEK